MLVGSCHLGRVISALHEIYDYLVIDKLCIMHMSESVSLDVFSCRDGDLSKFRGGGSKRIQHSFREEISTVNCF